MTLRELAQALNAELVGASGEEEVLGLTGLRDAAPGHVTFVENERRLAEGESGPALALIAPEGLSSAHKPLLRAANPRLLFCRALALLYPAPRLPAGVHPTAAIGEGVELGEQVAIGPYVVVGDGARIGAGSQIHALSSIGRKVALGENCLLFPRVTLYDGVTLGSRVVIQAGGVVGSAGFGYVRDGEAYVWMPHIGTVTVGDDVEIGANTTVDRGTIGATVIGDGTKIDNLVQVAHNVVIGRHCILAGQVGLSGSVVLEDGVVLAGQVGVADHARLGPGVMGGAGSGIFHDTAGGLTVLGRPARPISRQLRVEAAASRLPEALRELSRLRKRVEELERRTEG